jgi:hypothetical protein
MGLLRRVRLEQARRARKRIRVVECWPGEPKPQGTAGRDAGPGHAVLSAAGRTRSRRVRASVQRRIERLEVRGRAAQQPVRYVWWRALEQFSIQLGVA